MVLASKTGNASVLTYSWGAKVWGPSPSAPVTTLGAHGLRLALTSNGSPLVGYYANTKLAAVARVTPSGAGWSALLVQDGSAQGVRSVPAVALARAPDGSEAAVISFLDPADKYRLRVKRFSGGAWRALGGAVSAGAVAVGAHDIAASRATGEVVVVYR